MRRGSRGDERFAHFAIIQGISANFPVAYTTTSKGRGRVTEPLFISSSSPRLFLHLLFVSSSHPHPSASYPSPSFSVSLSLSFSLSGSYYLRLSSSHRIIPPSHTPGIDSVIPPRRERPRLALPGVSVWAHVYVHVGAPVCVFSHRAHPSVPLCSRRSAVKAAEAERG